MAALGVVALAIALLATQAALASLYVSATRDVVRHAAGQHSPVEAAQLSVRLAPWRAASHRAVAEALAATGTARAASQAAIAAVRANPADGYAWGYLARVTAAKQRLDPRLAGFYVMALHRSPNSPPLREAIAFDGVLYWRGDDPELHRIWRDAMAYALKRNQRAFLRLVMQVRREAQWCAVHNDHLPIGTFCNWARNVRAECTRNDLAPEAQAWCRDVAGEPERR